MARAPTLEKPKLDISALKKPAEQEGPFGVNKPATDPKDKQEEEKKQALAPALSIIDAAKPATSTEGPTAVDEAEKLRLEQAEKEKAFASKPLEYVT